MWGQTQDHRLSQDPVRSPGASARPTVGAHALPAATLAQPAGRRSSASTQGTRSGLVEVTPRPEPSCALRVSGSISERTVSVSVTGLSGQFGALTAAEPCKPLPGPQAGAAFRKYNWA